MTKGGKSPLCIPQRTPNHTTYHIFCTSAQNFCRKPFRKVLNVDEFSMQLQSLLLANFLVDIRLKNRFLSYSKGGERYSESAFLTLIPYKNTFTTLQKLFRQSNGWL